MKYTKAENENVVAIRDKKRGLQFSKVLPFLRKEGERDEED